jgi:hypothetical protein
MAVASAIRILGQREAAFPIHEISRTALDLGISGVTIEAVEARVRALADKGQLLYGTSGRSDGTVTHVTTPELLLEERRLLEGIDAGRGAVAPVLSAGDAATRLADHSTDRPLSGEQLDAGILALSSNDRVVVIQGVAGAGKTTLISAIADAARHEGRQVLGLAQANTMVEMLKTDAGIEAQTVSSFVNQHLKAALAGQGEAFAASTAALKDTVLVLDEASLVANKPMNDLVTIANRLGIDRLVMIGDRAQLQPIDAGKAFTLIQQHRPAMAHLEISHRQRTEHMKSVAALTRAGHFKDAFVVLGERVVNAGPIFVRQPPANGSSFRLRIANAQRSMHRAAPRAPTQCACAGRPEGRRHFARGKSCPFPSGGRPSHARGIALCQQLPGRSGFGGGQSRQFDWT